MLIIWKLLNNFLFSCPLFLLIMIELSPETYYYIVKEYEESGYKDFDEMFISSCDYIGGLI